MTPRLNRGKIANFLRPIWPELLGVRVRVVPHLSSGIVERAKRKSAWKSPHERKGDTPPRLAFLAWSDFHARSRFAPSTILDEKWGIIRSLIERKLKPCTDGLALYVIYLQGMYNLNWRHKDFKGIQEEPWLMSSETGYTRWYTWRPVTGSQL